MEFASVPKAANQQDRCRHPVSNMRFVWHVCWLARGFQLALRMEAEQDAKDEAADENDEEEASPIKFFTKTEYAERVVGAMSCLLPSAFCLLPHCSAASHFFTTYFIRFRSVILCAASKAAVDGLIGHCLLVTLPAGHYWCRPRWSCRCHLRGTGRAAPCCCCAATGWPAARQGRHGGELSCCRRLHRPPDRRRHGHAGQCNTPCP